MAAMSSGFLTIDKPTSPRIFNGSPPERRSSSISTMVKPMTSAPL
jgi:hypothetical protein